MTDKEINWITEKCGTNEPPKEPPKARSIGNKLITDGVNVAECDYMFQGNTGKVYCNIDEVNCTNNDCYYKQLQREKQLNKVNLQRSLELNRELNNLQDELQREKQKNEELAQDIYVLNKKNEELEKRLNNCSESWGKDALTLDWYKQSDQAKQEENFNLTMKVEEYKQALKEIEEIVFHKILSEELSNLDIDFDEYEANCRETDYSNIVTYSQEILDKIKEVLNA